MESRMYKDRISALPVLLLLTTIALASFGCQGPRGRSDIIDNDGPIDTEDRLERKSDKLDRKGDRLEREVEREIDRKF